MFVIKELLIPRSTGANLTPIPIENLINGFEESISEALFSFPYNPDKYQYVINVREEKGIDEYLLIIDPKLQPEKDQLFVTVINDVPVVKKYDPLAHRSTHILGTLAHASKAASIVI
jgi:hypothetical protein